MKPYHLILTCEHAVNTIPAEFQPFFEAHADLLKTHRGLDIGALGIIQTLSKALKTPFFQATTSRLLIDTNRSLHHRSCFSSITHPLAPALKEKIVTQYYQPYRTKVLDAMKAAIQQNQVVLHLSIHSFTPLFDGKERHGDLCLLYDPARPLERQLANQWQPWLKQQAPNLIIRKNYPYMGKTDGLASFCRKQFDDKHYVGFEIESNQAKVSQPANQVKFGELLAAMVGSRH